MATVYKGEKESVSIISLIVGATLSPFYVNMAPANRPRFFYSFEHGSTKRLYVKGLSR